jgi:hypothetical protein
MLLLMMSVQVRLDNVYIGNESECCRFVEAVVLWVDRSGDCCQSSTASGTASTSGSPAAEMLAHFAGDADTEHLIIDSTLGRDPMQLLVIITDQ